MRWLRDEGFWLEVPRTWPGGHYVEKRKAFIELHRIFLNDEEIDVWYLDESGLEGYLRQTQ